MTSAVTSISHLPTACNQPGSASHTTPSNNSDVTLPPAPIIPGYSTSTIAAGASTNAPKCSRSSRSGRWTPDEKLLFLHGLHIFGRGRWKKIRQFLPTRTLIQIKSHAQKVLKREEAGDDIFIPLRNNKARIKDLIKDKSRLFQNITPILSSDSSHSYGIMQTKRLSACPNYYGPPVGSSGIAPFSFVSTDKANSPEHSLHPPQASLSVYHTHPRHHHSTHLHAYHPAAAAPLHLASHKIYDASPSHSQRQHSHGIQSGSTPHLEVEKPPTTKTTDVLAATALCELFRGNNDEVSE